MMPLAPLNADAYAFMVLQDEYRQQMDRHARLRERERDIQADLDRTQADALTAAERATSIMETLLKLEQPRDSDGTPTGAINEDLSVPKDCQARAESIAQNKPHTLPSPSKG